MEEKLDHNKIINNGAKQILKPAGLVRKGQSRTWLDDNGWYTTIVEFQPSSYSKGTYLNVGINFNWYNKNYFSFDYGNRCNSFVECIDQEKFELAVMEMSQVALDKVFEYRKFRNMQFAKEKLSLSLNFENGLWENYHCAMICILTKDYSEAVSFLMKLLSIECNYPWGLELKENTRFILQIVGNEQLLNIHINKLINNSRQLLKLPVKDYLLVENDEER